MIKKLTKTEAFKIKDLIKKIFIRNNLKKQLQMLEVQKNLNSPALSKSRRDICSYYGYAKLFEEEYCILPSDLNEWRNNT